MYYFTKNILMDKKKIVIVGSNGYIGSVVTSYLLKKKFKIIGIDNLIYKQKKIKFKTKSYTFVQLDFGDKKVLKYIGDSYCVIILAGLVGDPITKKYKRLSESINYHRTLKFIKFCKHKNIKKLIFISTCSNYGISKKKKLLNEDEKLNPISLYAKQKVKIEKYLISKNFNFQIVILRFATAFGFSKRMRFDLTVNEFVKDAYLEKKIEVYEPHTFRPYCHVKDFARIIYLVIKKKFNKKIVLNCGSNKNNFSKQQITELLKKKIRSLNVNYVNKIKDSRNYKVNFSKIKKELNFKAKYSMEYGIKEVIKFIKKKKTYTFLSRMGNYKIKN